MASACLLSQHSGGGARRIEVQGQSGLHSKTVAERKEAWSEEKDTRAFILSSISHGVTLPVMLSGI